MRLTDFLLSDAMVADGPRVSGNNLRLRHVVAKVFLNYLILLPPSTAKLCYICCWMPWS